ncbi:MptD family putative ECF transporter S component [Mailhella massiliensis]|uniref:MptD family putative ECF transporter S component n=1 Tax=Mailhella massiliensis TaxID=1903261 RepID=UPI0023F0F862|nr:MptD family putative ECF transporter S component [Mailhella massiliensis]
MTRFLSCWSARELVVIGVFAAASKVATLLVALAGGGMNPISLMGKNLVFTTLLVVMLCKVHRPGTLLLFTVINIIVSMLLLGASVTLLPPMLVAALAAEAAMWPGRTAGGARNAVIGAAVFDIVSKVLSLGVSLLFLRENPAMMVMAVPFVAIGYLGSVGGLFSGVRAVRELRHAGIIHQ